MRALFWSIFFLIFSDIDGFFYASRNGWKFQKDVVNRSSIFIRFQRTDLESLN